MRVEGQGSEQFGTELRPGWRLTDDEGACSADIHHIIAAQFCGEDAWAKRPMPPNIDTSQEDNESHSGEYMSTEYREYRFLAALGMTIQKKY